MKRRLADLETQMQDMQVCHYTDVLRHSVHSVTVTEIYTVSETWRLSVHCIFIPHEKTFLAVHDLLS